SSVTVFRRISRPVVTVPKNDPVVSSDVSNSQSVVYLKAESPAMAINAPSRRMVIVPLRASHAGIDGPSVRLSPDACPVTRSRCSVSDRRSRSIIHRFNGPAWYAQAYLEGKVSFEHAMHELVRDAR